MSAKKEVDVSIFNGVNEYLRKDSDWPPSDPAGFLAWFAAKVALIPPQFAHAAYITLSGGGGGDYDDRHAEISIGYTRLETDAETAARDEQTRRYVQEREDSERREFERLQNKYGKK